MQFSLGALNNVVFKNEKIKIPADFVVVENEKGVQSNNLLGPNILTTTGAHNNVKEERTFFLREKVERNFLSYPTKYPPLLIKIQCPW